MSTAANPVALLYDDDGYVETPPGAEARGGPIGRQVAGKEFLDAFVFRRSFLFPAPIAIQKRPEPCYRLALRKWLHIRLECVHGYELATLRFPPSVARDFSKSTLILPSSVLGA